MARVELLDASPAPRTGIDADWSPRKRRTVVALASLLALVAVVGGVWLYIATRPIGLPNSAQEAIDTIRSKRFDALDPDRKGQILAEADRLFAALTPEQKAALKLDTQAMTALKKAAFNDYARRYARGEDIKKDKKPCDGSPATKKPTGDGQHPADGGKDADQAAAAARAGRDAWLAGMREGHQSGNAQDAALQGEFWAQWTRGSGAAGGGGGAGAGK